LLKFSKSKLSHTPSREQPGNLSPPVSQNGVGFEDDEVFFIGPGTLFDQWVELVVPALTTLFPQPSFQLPCDQGPVFGAVLVHQL